ncbi:uncharacterized protein LOC132621571 [Lycium barbarum]|uniref:uncharacterized protein LOC132621571 n=1 Tax=Lycium barbarum TaxID=112863 RepID=UPI00293E1D68|nr:uncharacterized protein LOC132621571 [Lycium barbarum]
MVKHRRQVGVGPQFFKIILSPHSSKLQIPDEFLVKYGADLRDVVSLEVPSGAKWEVKLQNSNGMTWLKEGWNQFKEYYSIGCGYFLLFKYNGNSHFSVFIFDLSASEIEYPSGPNEDMPPENVVNIVGDASHKKKVCRPETQNNSCDDIMNDSLRNKTAKGIAPENVVNIVGDASHKKKACRPETQNNSCDDIMKDSLRNRTAKDIAPENVVNIVGDASHKKKAGRSETQHNSCDDIMNDSLRNKTAKDIAPENVVNIVGDASHKKKAGRSETQNNSCDDIMNDSLRNKTAKDIAPENVVNIVGDASHKKKAGRPETQNNSCDDIMNESLRNKTAKVTEIADHSYSKRQKSGVRVFHPNRVKLEKPDVEEDLSCAMQEDKRKEIKENLKKQNMEKNLHCAADRGNEDCNEVLDPSTFKMTNTTKCNKRKYSISLEASRCRYPLRSKQVKLEQSDENGSPSYSGKQRPAASLSSPGTQLERKKSNRAKLEKANSKEDFCCAAPKEKKETNMEKLVKQDRQHNLYGEAYKFEGLCNEVPVMDPSASKVTTTNQHSRKKIAISLDASNCRYPLRNKQLKEVKIEKGDVEENHNEIPVVDPSATKMTTTNRHHEKKTSASLDTSRCRYPLRSNQLKEVKLEKQITEEDLLYVAQKAKRKKANNVKLENRDVEEHCKEIPMGDPSATKKTTTNRDNEKKITTSLDASHCRYQLRSKQLKLEQREARGNMHSKTPKNIVADSPYCKKQNSGLPAPSPSPSCQPIRVKLEKQDNLFCAAEKAKGKETNNVKLETGDMEGNLNSAANKGKDSTASELKNNWQEKGVTLREAQLRNAVNFNPNFTVSMQPTYVSRNFQLDLPDNFFNKYIKEGETIVNLRVSDGRTWRAKLFIRANCAKIQLSDWRDFVLGNSLKEHDTCVFELIDAIEPVLDVSIFRAKTPVS